MCIGIEAGGSRAGCMEWGVGERGEGERQASSHVLPRVRNRGRSRLERGFEALATDHLFPVPHISK